MKINLPRAGAIIATAAVTATLVLTPTVAQAATSPQAASAAAWLADQVPSGSHLFESVYGTGPDDKYVDYGLNLDLQYALTRFGDTSTADKVYGAVVANTAEYTDAYGTRYAGAVGKLATYVSLHGDDPTKIDDRNLIEDLEGLMVTQGPETGRLKDAPDSEYQSANTIGQSWGVRALATVGSASSTDAEDFLVQQQCSDGGFRLYQSGAGCSSSIDATAFAIAALDATGGHEAVVDEAGNFLRDAQASDGSFSDAGNPNANSTGLAAVALGTVGKTTAAAAAADWVVPLQATSSTPGLGDEAGAIAFDKAAFKTGKSAGIGDLVRDQWVRTTVQAAFGVEFATEPEPEPEPGPVASMKLTLSDSTPTQGDTITITATGKDADGRSTGDVSDELRLTSSVETDTIDGNTVTFNHASPHTITATHVPTDTTSSVTIQVKPLTVESPTTDDVDGSTTGPVANTNATLPDAGSSVQTWQLLAAVALLAAGAGLVLTGRGRRLVFLPSHARR
ncbi:prenyltransferase/squalene oxidase repeat-containing protein [Aeromicrobium sp.]|uniref:prenyltransferase/squalene oxidase repeat-containing protein n=1 Tax=Aeromicrobium sp. TaxID=1871063 RepID=UPI003C661618